MYYSLTFDSIEGTAKNTWVDWGLIPTSPPMIPPPQPNKNLANIPGRKAGPIDLSREPFGYLTYPRITGTWEFMKEETSLTTRASTYETIRTWLHGRTTTVITEDDPTHYYQGIFTIDMPESGANTVGIKINFDLEPLRYNLNGTEDTNYLIR